MIVLALLACVRCPDGLVRDGRRCVPAGGGSAGPAEPPTESEFVDRLEDELCDALEDCYCEAWDLDTCDPDVDCPRVSALAGCTFVPEEAAACLSERFACDPDPDGPVVTMPDACGRVWQCPLGDSGDTG